MAEATRAPRCRQKKNGKFLNVTFLIRFSAAFLTKGLRVATLRRMMGQAAILPSLKETFLLNRW